MCIKRFLTRRLGFKSCPELFVAESSRLEESEYDVGLEEVDEADVALEEYGVALKEADVALEEVEAEADVAFDSSATSL